MPETLGEIAALRARLSEARARGLTVGFVPTMGALHAGHEALLAIARRENHFVVASIFVNPLQFDRKEDLDRYPRTMDADLLICDRHGVNLVICALAGGALSGGQLTFVDSPALASTCAGSSGPVIFAASRQSY